MSNSGVKDKWFDTRYNERIVNDLFDSYKTDEDSVNNIFRMLLDQIEIYYFCDYLKRYIWRNMGENEDSYNTFSDEEYQKIIIASFKENETPASFDPTNKAKLSALVKNWLKQKTVKRKVVLLLGFGLGMTESEVNELLEKGIKEKGMNPKSPLEAICCYCFRKGYKYPAYQALWEKYKDIIGTNVNKEYDNQYTVGVMQSFDLVQNEAALKQYLSQLKSDEVRSKHSISGKKYFDDLYFQARELIAEAKNISGDFDKVFKGEDIREVELENELGPTIPKDNNGNLVKAKTSILNAHFSGKRFSRKRLNDIVQGAIEVDRFDLITLSFFIFSMNIDKYGDRETQQAEFKKKTNEILNQCGWNELYLMNPYEQMVLACIGTEDPLVTYTDILALAYGGKVELERVTTDNQKKR